MNRARAWDRLVPSGLRQAVRGLVSPGAECEECHVNQREPILSLVETSQDLIWQCDAEGRYTFLNGCFTDSIAKPFTLAELGAMLERNLKRSS